MIKRVRQKLALERGSLAVIESRDSRGGRRVNGARRACWAIGLLTGLVLLCGCAQQYIIRLANGDRVASVTKPRLEGSFYHFRDHRGEDQVVARKYVVKIRRGYIEKEKPKPAPSEKPAKRVKPQPPPSPFPPPPPPRKTKHWYFLWLK